MAFSGTQTTRFAHNGTYTRLTGSFAGKAIEDILPDGLIGGIATFVETARKGSMFVGGTTGSQALPVETARPNAKLEDT